MDENTPSRLKAAISAYLRHVKITAWTVASSLLIIDASYSLGSPRTELLSPTVRFVSAVVVSALIIEAIINRINRRDDPGHAKRPPDTP